MTVLYFGDPRGALALLDRGVTLTGMVHGRRGGPGWATLLRRIDGVPRWHLPDLADPAVVAAFAAGAPRLIVACFYPRRIPAPVLAIAPGLNAHPSDLPRWRGPDPCAWAIRAGDDHTAICIHRLTEGLDEGDVLVREQSPIGARETGGELADRLEARGAALIAEVAAQWLAGAAPTPKPQVGTPTWAPLLPDNAWEIDWRQPAVEVDRLVRAAAPEPGAFSGLGDELLVVLRGAVADGGRFEALEAGTPFVRGGQVFLRCGEGAYRLDRVRLGRRSLTGRALAGLLV